MFRLGIDLPAEATSYQLIIGAGAYTELVNLTANGKYSKVFLLTTPEVWKNCQELIAKYLPLDFKLIEIQSGEEHKTLTTLENVLHELSFHGADRRSLLVNFGGGVVGDLGGFAASVYMRGIDFVQAPTTLLSQVDASVGGKTGINFNHVKNLLGAFQQPKAVLINPETLKSLPVRELSSGMAENIKHALIADSSFIDYLENFQWPVRDFADFSDLIAKSVAIKAQVVRADPKEAGLRKILNFGHTAGHALESLCLNSAHPLAHGEAVALGMLMEGELAVSEGLISEADLKRIEKLILKFNLPNKVTVKINPLEFEAKLLTDKKNSNQQIKWVLLKKLGEAVIDQSVSAENLAGCLGKYLDSTLPKHQDSGLSLLGKVRDATVNLKGSKSLTNRALILAGQSVGKSILYNPAICDDAQVVIEALRKFGVKIEWSEDSLLIDRPEVLTPYEGIIDVGPAGTAMRFLTSFVATVPGALVELRGSERMHQRPINDLVDALTSQGLQIKYLGTPNCPPLRILGREKEEKFTVDIKANISSQFLSSIMLSAPSLAKSVEINIVGDLISKSYIDLTLQVMKDFGVNVIEEEGNYFLIFDSLPQSGAYQIDGDATGAGYFWCLAAASSQAITVNNLSPESKQGDLDVVPILEKIGCEIQKGERSITVIGKNKLATIHADLEQLPDSAQTLAVLASLIPGTSRLTGLSTLKNKETDRLRALSQELKKLNIKTVIGDDFIEIYGGTIKIPETGVEIETYDDHRMAMSFAILASIYPEIKIADPQVVSKSFPDFWQQLEICGLEIV